MPSAQALLESLHGRVYCATVDAPVEDRRVVGWGGSGEGLPTAITISAVGVDTETSTHPVWPAQILVDQLVSRAVHRTELTFPATLTVERSEHVISIDGRDQPLTAYTCGDTLVASLPADDVVLRVTCPLVVFQRGFRMISLSEREIARLVGDPPQSSR